jgi:hypothetical protein
MTTPNVRTADEIEETARHAGHMDIVRELLDGATGDHRRRPPSAG